MQEETVVFKLDVSNERIKRKAMKVVWKFSRVTLVDIKKKDRLKVRGNFDKMEMGLKLKKIDKSVDIIDSMGIGEQNCNPGTSNMQDTVVFDWGSVDARTKEKAMKVVCEFPGVTVIDVKEKGKLKVTGQFDKFIMTKKLKKICDYVDIIAVGPAGQSAQNRNLVNKPEPKVIRGRPTIPQKKKSGKKSDECIIL